MLLAIEQGNTNTLFAVHDGDAWIAQWRAATDPSRTADEYAAWLHQLLNLQDLKFSDLHACIISSVVPQSIFNLRNLVRRYVKVEPLGRPAQDAHTYPRRTSLAHADRAFQPGHAHRLEAFNGPGAHARRQAVCEDGERLGRRGGRDARAGMRADRGRWIVKALGRMNQVDANADRKPEASRRRLA